jgi:hypothetical protein
VSNDRAYEVLAAGLCTVFPWLNDEAAMRIFVDAAIRCDIEFEDAVGLTELAEEMSAPEDLADERGGR